jgi:hypothetical protein
MQASDYTTISKLIFHASNKVNARYVFRMAHGNTGLETMVGSYAQQLH